MTGGGEESPAPDPAADGAAWVLVAAVFAAAVAALVFELTAGALSSYLLGDSVTQFSLVIGLFLSAMGVGSFLSKFVRGDLPARFVQLELAIGVIGGCTALAGFAAFAFTEVYNPVLLGLVTVVGALVGLEIPIVVRIVRDLAPLRVTLAHVLSADYAGALAASLAFPFLLLPHLGLVQAGLAAGLFNVGVAGLVVWRMGPLLGRRRAGLAVLTGVCAAGMTVALVFSGTLVTWFENRVYRDEIILARTTEHQRIVITRWRADVRLFLNGHLQFSSVDEYRYHEALVHPAMSLAESPRRVLILGGGDGMAAREVLRFDGVERVDLVDMDPVVTGLFRDRPLLADLNDRALHDPRVHVHNRDAFKFLEDPADDAPQPAVWDVILMDLPDPSEPALAKLYSRAFFRLAGRRLAAGGMLAGQAGSPFRAREAYWCIVHTIESTEVPAAPGGAGPTAPLRARPYHTTVPTFGQWGFVIAGRRMPDLADVRPLPGARHLTADVLGRMAVFPPDMTRVETEVNDLNTPVLHDLYRRGYHRYMD